MVSRDNNGQVPVAASKFSVHGTSPTVTKCTRLCWDLSLAVDLGFRTIYENILLTFVSELEEVGSR